MRTYFAHYVGDYGTPIEVAAHTALMVELGEIVNPNTPEHHAGYQAGGMQYFFDLIADLDAVAFMRMPCGSVGAGVAIEVEDFARRGLPVFEIERDGLSIRQLPPGFALSPVLSVEETRAALRALRAAA